MEKFIDRREVDDITLDVRGWSDLIKGSQGKECRKSLETSKGKGNIISTRAVRSE